MPAATGGGGTSRPRRPPRPAPPRPDPSARPASQSQRIGNAIPNPTPQYTGTETGVGGNTGISRAAKQARQHRQSEAKHAVRRRLESKRDQMEKGKGRAKYGTEAGDGTGSSASDIIRSKRAFMREGGRTKFGGDEGSMQRATVRLTGDSSGPRTHDRYGRRINRPGGTTYGDTDGGRTGGFGSRGVDGPLRPSSGGVRIGGGHVAIGDPRTPDPQVPRTRPTIGGGTEGGGQTGGATNPLTSGSIENEVRGLDLEDVLHGAKKGRRERKRRGTE